MALDEIITELGFGLYQLKNYILASQLMLFQACQMFIVTFVGRKIPYHCKNISPSNISWTPLQIHNMKFETNYTYDKCSMYESIVNHTVVPCKYGWEYQMPKTSIVAEWDLVCAREWLIPLASSIFMGGSVCGALLFALASDAYGRRPTLFVSSAAYSVAALLTAFVPSYPLYLGARFFQGFVHAGNFVLHIVILSEILPKNKRYLIPIMATICFSLGYAVLAGLAYLIPEWRYLQFVTGSLLGLYFVQTFFMDESIYWLVAKGRLDEASKLIFKAARWNKVDLKFQTIQELETVLRSGSGAKKSETSETKLIDLFVHPELRRRTLLINFGTLFLSQIYMGLTFSAHILPGNLYMNFSLIGLTEIPGKLLSLFAIRLGRRKPIFIMNSCCALFLLLLILLPLIGDVETRDALNIILFMTSRSLTGGSLAVIFVLISEIFPTPVRNTGYGLNNSLTRAGFLVSPFISYLENVHVILMPAILAGFAMLSALLISALPPTKDLPLPESLDDLVRRKSKKTSKWGIIFPSDAEFKRSIQDSLSIPAVSGNGAKHDETSKSINLANDSSKINQQPTPMTRL